MADAKGKDPKLPIGSRYCQCPHCLEYFTSDAAFSAHRKGEADARYCLTEQAMRARGMATNERGYWVTKPVESGTWGPSTTKTT